MLSLQLSLAVDEGVPAGALFESPSSTFWRSEQSGGWNESGQMGELEVFYQSVAAASCRRGIPQRNRGPVLTKGSMQENPVLLHDS